MMKITELTCEEDFCKNKPYYEEYSCDGPEFYCRKHGNIIILANLKDRLKNTKAEIRTTAKQIKCQNSKEGHTFPPPPKIDNPWEISTSGSLDFMHGTPHTCTKCDYTYYDPSGILNISDVSFNVSENFKQIDIPELVCNIPEGGPHNDT